MKKTIIAALMLCMAFCPAAYAGGHGRPNMPVSHSHHSAHVVEYGKSHHHEPRPHHSQQHVEDSDVVAAGAVTLAIVGVVGFISMITNGCQK